MKKTIIGAFIILISGLIVMAFVSICEKDKLEKELIEKQRTIESQAQLLIEKNNEIESCDWYKNYYYDHVCEDGCDVAE